MWEHGLLDVPLICHFSCWFFKLSLIVIILMERTVSCSVLWFSLVDLSFTGFIVSWFQKRNSQAPKRIKFYIQSLLNFIKSYNIILRETIWSNKYGFAIQKYRNDDGLCVEDQPASN